MIYPTMQFNMGRERLPRKPVARLFEPLGNTESFGACIGCGVNLGEVMPKGRLCLKCAACHERKKGTECQSLNGAGGAMSRHTSESSCVPASALQDSGSNVVRDIGSPKSPSSPLASDSPESARWVPFGCQYRKGTYTIMQQKDRWHYGQGVGWEGEAYDWREIDAKLFPKVEREFRVGDPLHGLEEFLVALHGIPLLLPLRFCAACNS